MSFSISFFYHSFIHSFLMTLCDVTFLAHMGVNKTWLPVWDKRNFLSSLFLLCFVFIMGTSDLRIWQLSGHWPDSPGERTGHTSTSLHFTLTAVEPTVECMLLLTKYLYWKSSLFEVAGTSLCQFSKLLIELTIKYHVKLIQEFFVSVYLSVIQQENAEMFLMLFCDWK